MSIPDDFRAKLAPIPDDFAVQVEQFDRYVRWHGSIPREGDTPVKVELGFSLAGGKANIEKEMAQLRTQAWEVLELGRLGYFDLIAYALVDRHKGKRPILAPQLEMQKQPDA